MNCRIPDCNERHHIDLNNYTDKLVNIASITLNNNNNLEKNTFLQIIAITISNGTKYIKTNSLLDTGSNATLLKSDIAKKLGLNRDCRKIRITIAFSKTPELESK